MALGRSRSWKSNELHLIMLLASQLMASTLECFKSCPRLLTTKFFLLGMREKPSRRFVSLVVLTVMQSSNEFLLVLLFMYHSNRFSVSFFTSFSFGFICFNLTQFTVSPSLSPFMQWTLKRSRMVSSFNQCFLIASTCSAQTFPITYSTAPITLDRSIAIEREKKEL